MAPNVWMFLLAMTLPDLLLAKIISDKHDYLDLIENDSSAEESNIVREDSFSKNDGCLARLEAALTSITKQRATNAAVIDFSGYALHQPLKTIPLDMYVMDMRVKIPTNSIKWAQIEQCRFDPETKIMQAKLVFQDLVVTAVIKLFNEDILQFKNSPLEMTPSDKCNMTLRLRQAGLGFVVTPHQVQTGAIGIRTSATFVDPNFVSIRADNCQPINPNDQQRNRAGNYNIDRIEPRSLSNEDVSQEMEDVFLRGIRSLLTKYMEKQLQPALKDTLMINLGYTLSYGKK